jgi:hypothetical protein
MSTKIGGKLKVLALSALLLIVMLIISILIGQQMSDGPIGPMPGGSFRSGEIVAEPVEDWSFVESAESLPEFELVGPGSSRTAGVILLNGTPYIPCDLGFMWNREYESGSFIPRLLWYLKTWHTKVENDGRIVIRLDGKRYGGHATRVKDEPMVAALKAKLEVMGGEFYGLDKLPPPREDGPHDIWFFRVESRAL